MRHRLVLTAVFGLAVVFALGIGAAPALAQDGCDCHTAVPPTNGAPAAHAPFVASVSQCTVCHVDWTAPPHPAASTSVLLLLSGSSSDSGYLLRGQLGVKLVHPGVVVYLQQRLWGATEWTDLTQATTDNTGKISFMVVLPQPFAAYRAVARGHVGPGIVGTLLYMPKRKTLLPTPELTLAIRGFDRTNMFVPARCTLGHTLTVHGTVAPADVGGRITIRVHKRVNHKWVTCITRTRAISDTGTYSWKWTPKSRGAYRVDARIPATAAHRGVLTRFSKGPLHTFYVH